MSSSSKKDRVSSSRTSTEKEAKALSDELYALLGKRDPWHQDVMFARENLRRHCLALIFKPVADSDGSSVVAAQSKKRLQGLNVLFLSTSHNVIHHFRQRLSAMDKLMAQAASERTGSRAGGERASSGKRNDRNSSGGSGSASVPTPAQRRRLLHSFRDFLAKEEIFWRDLLIRIVGVFDVEEARTPLRLLQLGVGDWEAELRFAGNKEIHDQAILLCHKTLICFGDLARYKELYSENRNDKGPKPRGGKLAPRPAGTEKDKSWSRAYEAYHQARLLVPDDGNPSNQLAVLAGYQHDNLSTIYHYYRALCVRKAFTAARQNLAPTFAKILSHWESAEKQKADKRKLRAGNGSYSDVDNDDEQNKLDTVDATVLVEDFKKAFVVLHAILFQASHMEQLSSQFTAVTKMFSACVKRRILPSDVVVKVIVTAISSWWYARMYKRSAGKEGEAAGPIADSAALESSALMHALAMLSELMSIAVKETQDVDLPEMLQHPPTLAKRERPMLLAQSITAILRRALPALRIASMWLLSNADYLARYDSTSTLFKADDASIPPEVCAAIRGFWNSYIAFANSLKQAFPADLLPLTSGDLMLEEDIDMLGFAPLRRRMKEASIGKAAKEVSGALATAAATSSTLHPNEEQVLRVGDLLADAGLLAQSESCPVVLEKGYFAIRKKRLNPASQPWNPIKATPPSETRVISPASEEEDEDDGNNSLDGLEYPDADNDLEVSEEGYEATEDDVLDLAMRVATGNKESSEQDYEDDEEEDDDEEILYPSKVTQASYTNRLTASTPSPPGRHAAPPAASHLSAAAGPTRTASDLLLQVLQGNSMDLRSSPTLPSAVPAGLGASASISGSPFVNTASSPAPAGLAGHSIWSGTPFSTTSNSPASHQRTATNNSSLISGKAASTEALFNSMPNQSQQPQQPIGSGLRQSPSVGPFGLDGQYRPSAGTPMPGGLSGSLGATSNIWGAPPSPRRKVGSMQNQQSYQQQPGQYGRQYG